MKKRFLNTIRNSIKNQYPNYSDDKLDEIMYGVEGIYLTITKTIIIFAVAFLLGIAKELFFLLLSFNFVRLFAFGMHADKSWICLLFSSSLFIGGTFICKYIFLNNILIYILYLLMLIIIILYSPADTIKRPLINKKKRKKFKILSIMITLIYLLITIFTTNKLLINSLLVGLLIECILILPITYNLFNMPYRNYKKYDLNTK